MNTSPSLTLIDSHAHLIHEGSLPLEQMLTRAQAAGIAHIINIATSPDEAAQGMQLSARYPWISLACATTPHDAESKGDTDFAKMAAHARAGHLVAVGETGLDYHLPSHSKSAQRILLCRYFALAMECHLPMIIHCRDAFADFFSLLDTSFQGTGVLHCFTGTLDEAKQLIARDWFLSLSGIVTFKNSLALQEVARWVPLDHLLIETDAPYLAPHPYRGKPNEPAYLVHTAQCIANLRHISLEELARQTTKNAQTLFPGLSKKS